VIDDEIISQGIGNVKDAIREDAFQGKKVLVTGGAGFIGSWLCDTLVGLGAGVTALDDLSTGKIENINHLTGNLEFRFLQCNVSAFKTGERFDYIFHLAGHASPEEYQLHPIETLQVSAFGSASMAELARKSDATIVFTSTSEIYGDAEVLPTPETYWGKVNPIGPRSCYDEGKRFAEALFVAYHRQYGLKLRIPRVFNSYGPRLREDGFYGRAMSRFIMQALTDNPITIYGDGKQTRSFCYITDTITGLLLLTLSENANGEVVNIGSSEEIAILELAKKIKEATKCKSDLVFYPLPKDDPKRRSPDIGKLQKLVNWKPEVSFEEGLKKTIRWFSLKIEKHNPEHSLI
jgi:UDP-glucuronate decarboxylase